MKEYQTLLVDNDINVLTVIASAPEDNGFYVINASKGEFHVKHQVLNIKEAQP